MTIDSYDLKLFLRLGDKLEELNKEFEEIFSINPDLPFYGLRYIKSHPTIIVTRNTDGDEVKYTAKEVKEFISVYDDNEDDETEENI